MQIGAKLRPYDALFWKEECCHWKKKGQNGLCQAGRAGWDEGLRSFKSKIPEAACLCHLCPRWGGGGVTQCGFLASSFFVLTSLSLHHFVLRLSNSYTRLQNFFFLLTSSQESCSLASLVENMYNKCVSWPKKDGRWHTLFVVLQCWGREKGQK